MAVTEPAGEPIGAGQEGSAELGPVLEYRDFARPSSVAKHVKSTVQSVASQQARRFAAAQVLERELRTSFAGALVRARAAAARTPSPW